MTQDWKNNTVAELIHGPHDGAEIILPPGDKVIEVIEVPIIADWCLMVNHDSYKRLPIQVGVYRRNGTTLRFHTGAPATVKFEYQETLDDTEPVE